MAFRSVLKLDSPIFSRDKRRAAGGRAVRKAAADFAKDLQDKMENSPHTGRVVTKARGENFRVRHQQSRRGERPAPFSKKLLRSIRARRIDDAESIVEVGADHGEILQEKLGRKIITKTDEKEAQKQLDSNLSNEMKQLL